MHIERLKYKNWLMLLALAQIAALLLYLNANVVNVGAMGTALPILVAYVFLSILLFSFFWLQKSLYVRPHLFLFLSLIGWIAFRVVVDLGDLEYLKQITVATTGGMVLFYLLGAFLSVSMHSMLNFHVSSWLPKLVLVLFLTILCWTIYKFSQRMHPQLFYLTGVDGNYQRSGNFLTISFIIVSFVFLIQTLEFTKKNTRNFGFLIWTSVYTLSAFIAIAASQLFGSNSATAIVSGMYLITLVMALSGIRRVLYFKYLRNELALPWSKALLIRLSLVSLLGSIFFIASLVVIVFAADFDLSSIRLLGFGTGANTSLISRIEILAEHGAIQAGYAPFWGNINVAYLTTGSSAKTLHSLFPHVLANLGVVGFSVIIALFLSVSLQLHREIKLKPALNVSSFKVKIISIYSFLVIVFIISFSSIATGFSWAVLWFSLGLISKPFGFRFHEKYSYYSH